MSKFDLIDFPLGTVFGRLTVVGKPEPGPVGYHGSRGRRRWKVDCACGKKGLLIPTGSLSTGNTKSCGCLKKAGGWKKTQITDLLGKTFGRLTVVGLSEKPKSDGGRAWYVDCACGKKGLLVRGSDLKKGRRKSCGCLGREARQMVGVGVLTTQARYDRVLKSYQGAAKDRGFSWELSVEQAVDLLKRACVFCGSPPTRELGKGTLTSCFVNGIDRWNNEVGYTDRNCVTCCSICNYMKGTKSGGEFLAQIKRIYEHCRVVLDTGERPGL